MTFGKPTVESIAADREWRRKAAVKYQETQQRKPLRPRSPRMAREVAALRKEYDAFLAEPGHAVCEFPLGCVERSTCVHHLAGRCGWRLRFKTWWRGSCAFHNGWCEDNPAEADRIGWRLPRVGLIPEDMAS